MLNPGFGTQEMCKLPWLSDLENLFVAVVFASQKASACKKILFPQSSFY